MKTFNLPDLGEGLPEAEIVTWHVKPGDEIALDQPMLSVETAKAVVEVPAPYGGRVARLYAGEGDIVETGKPLIDIDTGSGAEPAGPATEATATPAVSDEKPAASADTGTVVGSMPVSDEELVETAVAGGRRHRAQARSRQRPRYARWPRRRASTWPTSRPPGAATGLPAKTSKISVRDRKRSSARLPGCRQASRNACVVRVARCRRA